VGYPFEDFPDHYFETGFCVTVGSLRTLYCRSGRRRRETKQEAGRNVRDTRTVKTPHHVCL